MSFYDSLPEKLETPCTTCHEAEKHAVGCPFRPEEFTSGKLTLLLYKQEGRIRVFATTYCEKIETRGSAQLEGKDLDELGYDIRVLAGPENGEVLTQQLRTYLEANPSTA